MFPHVSSCFHLFPPSKASKSAENHSKTWEKLGIKNAKTSQKNDPAHPSRGRQYLDVTSQLLREMERCFSRSALQMMETAGLGQTKVGIESIEVLYSFIDSCSIPILLGRISEPSKLQNSVDVFRKLDRYFYDSGSFNGDK